jgi:hypothetical protein
MQASLSPFFAVAAIFASSGRPLSHGCETAPEELRNERI